MVSNVFAIAQPNQSSVEHRDEARATRGRLFVPPMLAAIVLIGLALRLLTASNRSIWFDEAWSCA